mmetsp:Transcript_26132/g.65417  ORF Transcript_26132/g.65417 Transcript_26132/m.65417 type:complete len:414 (-) Transcript_26132:176-1417(-)|eukprot:CAMPEP_0181373600 /NCGR_PEP_ID=MMETSP1106-20121128/15477_1 /TAXON_ID=81844 /ORGANISM="Mantoniella antarctica, Strain SL-175" /LENGTH=413 /DNA_ID=CAMNT_0023491333 /DNA_START=178 /DNA_END=1419 /DNA_ORIENTATION=+
MRAATTAYVEAKKQPKLTGDLDVYLRINVISINVNFDGKPRGAYQLKFYLEACWDDSSRSIQQRKDSDAANPNKWDPRIFLPNMDGKLDADWVLIQEDAYPEKKPEPGQDRVISTPGTKFTKPMTAYRLMGTADFPAMTSKCAKDFPFDHHEINVVVRSREAEEKKNEDVTVRFHLNEQAKSDISPAETHPAYDMFDFAVEEETGSTYLGVHIVDGTMLGKQHASRRQQSFKAVMRIRRRPKDWIIQAVLPVLISAFVCGFSFMPPVCHLADRQQVSLGVLFTLVAFSLGLKSLDFYPKVPYFTFIDSLVLLNMLVMVLCVMFNALSYALHGTCMEGDAEFQTRSAIDWILLGIICFIWVFSNSALYVKIIWGRRRLEQPKGVITNPGLDPDGKVTPSFVKSASYRWQVVPAN